MSVWQPWATLLARGIKPVENRARWAPPRWVMESKEPVWIAIHASSSRASERDYARALSRARLDDADPRQARREWPRSSIVGVARFIGWMDKATWYSQWAATKAGYHDTYTDDHGWRYADSPWWSRGAHGLCFADAVEFAHPITGVRGQQAVWWKPTPEMALTVLDRRLAVLAREAA